jgi:putative ABC transport system permease protein
MSGRSVLARLLGIGRREARDDELDREIGAHLALLEDEYRRDGLSDDDARARARQAFGNVTLTRERTADAWSFPAIESVLQDVRYAGRMIRRAPGLSFVLIAIVAIAIAASTALYTLADACIIHAIRYPAADRWVEVRARKAEQRTFQNFSSVPELMDVERLTDVFEHVGAIIGTGFTLRDGAYPEFVDGTSVTAGVIPMLGVAPLLGRTFTEAEDRPGAPEVVVLSEEFWARHFDRDRTVLGRTMNIDGTPYTIVGVMPPNYSLWGGELWVPLQLDRVHLDREARQYFIIGVLRPGVTQAMADARLATLSQQMASDYRLTDPQYAQQRYETWSIIEAVTAGLKPAFFALSAAVVLLILLACINIATLLVARAVSRGRELSVRAAIGAGRRRLVRQMLTESIVLACAGGAAGVVLAVWMTPIVFRLIPPAYVSSTVDPHVQVNLTALLVAVGGMLVTGILFGAVPASLAAGSNLAASLNGRGTAGGPGSGRRMQTLLLVAEIALVLVVLASATLTIVSYRRLQMMDLGFVPDHVLTFSFSLPIDVYRKTDTIAAYHEDLLTRIRRIPGVVAAAETSLLPLGYRTVDVTTYDIDVEGHPVAPGGVPDNANFRIVSPGFFDTARTPLIEGRTFDQSDNGTKAAVALVNETMAREYFPGGALGRVFRLRERFGRRDLHAPVRSQTAPITVVGVVHDAKQTNVIDAPIRPEFFLPLAQRPTDARAMAVMLRTTGDPEAAAGAVRRIVTEMDPGQAINDFRTLDDSISASLGSRRLTLLLLSFFAVVSLALAALGLYAVTSHGVAQRTREIGIRMALGADARGVVALITREGLRVIGLGLLIGILASLAATRIVSAQLYGVSPTDPIVLASVAALLGGVALLAAWIPARRAVQVDPLVALRPD